MALFIYGNCAHFHRMIRHFFALLVLSGGLPLEAQERFRIDTVPAPSLRQNVLGDPDRRSAAIYLPRSYGTHSQRRYPVVYLLHGFGGGVEQFLKRIQIARPLDSLTALGSLGEMIVVVPDANNTFGGSFFRNSAVTGNWEDFVVRDLVSYMDANYRTIRSRRARGIGGWSMGGYGALWIAVRHPETFSAVYALSPCCLSPRLPYDTVWMRRGAEAVRTSDVAALSSSFNAGIVTALAAVYTPALVGEPLYVRFPWTVGAGGISVTDSIAEQWRNTPLGIVRRTSPRVLRSLRIGFDAGNGDAFRDIPAEVRALHALLQKKGIPHEFEMFRGTHGDRIRERLETRVMPFFSRGFQPEATGR